jgi:hypothetical protein
VVIVTPETGGFSLGLDVSVPPFSVQPGQSQTQMITIKWQGATKIVIQSIEFSSDKDIFKVGKTVPFAVVLTDAPAGVQVPLTVTLPSTEQGVAKTVQMRVAAVANGQTSSQTLPVLINLVPTNDLAIYGGIGIAATALIGVALKKRRR